MGTSNTRAIGRDYSRNELVKSTEFNTVDTNAAQSVNRTNTSGGYKLMPICIARATQYEFLNVSADGRFSFSVPSGASTYIFLPMFGLPDGQTLAGAKLKYKPATGHTAEPASLPTLQLYGATVNGTAGVIGATIEHTWVDTATYQAGITLEVTGISHTIDCATYDYYARVRVEAGSSAVSGSTIQSFSVDVDVSTACGGTDFCHWLLSD